MHVSIDIEKKLNSFRLNLSYQGNPGTLGILGASGCGKSMTLKSIAGIEKPDRGRIQLGDRVLFDSANRINLRPQERRVGYLFQNYALFPTMTVEGNIMAGIRGPRSIKKQRAAEMAERFQIKGLEKRLPGQLSGGQQQRVALARIMAYEPDALLLDEPFSAMDVFLRERLRLEMAELLKEYKGLSVLVTHDREEAYQLCDHLLLMHEGQIVADGPTGEIFERPGSVQAARLTGCKNISRIRRLESHKVCALDWQDQILITEEEVNDDTGYVGIRAHDFIPLNESEYCVQRQSQSLSVIRVNRPVITELPFEWYITLENGIWWKLPKDMHTHRCENQIPFALAVDPSNVMLLRDNL